MPSPNDLYATFHAQTPRWYDVRAQADDTTEILIYDAIDPFGVSASDFVRDLQGIDTPNITVRINSPGGLVFDGIAIYNALRQHPADVHVRVDGIAGSIASVIAMAGDTVTMLDATQMMIHDAIGLTFGPADEMREMADLLEQQSDIIAGIYARRADRPASEFRALMRASTWLTAEEAVDLGLADEVEDGEAIAAEFDLSLFDRVPQGACDGDFTKRKCERALRDAGATRSQAKAGAAWLLAQRDAAPPCPDARDAHDLAVLLDTLKGNVHA